MNHLSESASWFKTTVIFDNILAASTMKGFNHKEIIWNVDIIFNWERDVNICLTCTFPETIKASFKIKP